MAYLLPERAMPKITENLERSKNFALLAVELDICLIKQSEVVTTCDPAAVTLL